MISVQEGIKKGNTSDGCIALCTEGEARTPDTWFWRPVLYQLSYFRRNSQPLKRLAITLSNA